MIDILSKYYIEQGFVLVNYQEGINGVDCWFENDSIRCHRCLSFEDFSKLVS